MSLQVKFDNNVDSYAIGFLCALDVVNPINGIMCYVRRRIQILALFYSVSYLRSVLLLYSWLFPIMAWLQMFFARVLLGLAFGLTHLSS